MSDWLGLGFLILLLLGAYVGLRRLANPTARTAEEFEKGAAQNTTMLGASMNALNELMNPSAVKAKEVQMQMRDGRFMKKKKEGKSGAEADQ